MRKLLLTILTLCCSLSAWSQNITFDDANVKAICVKNWDTNKDGELSYEEAAAVKSLPMYVFDKQITKFIEFVSFTGLESIPNNTFYGQSSMTSILLPNSMSTIGDYAFWACRSLESITVPHNSVTSIGEGIFGECSNLKSVIIGNGVKAISKDAFWYCINLESVEIGSSVESIGEGAFSCCEKLQSITIPNSVTTIGSGAFDGCISLTDITWGSSVTDIGSYAFSGCYRLSSVIIPRTIKSIGSGAFNLCSVLTSVTVDIDTPLPIDANTFTNRFNATLYVPAGCRDVYKAANYWKDFKQIVEINSTTTATITISSAGIRTYCSSEALDFSDVEGLSAYIVSGFSSSTGNLTLTPVTKVPAGEGLLLKGAAGDYEVPFTTTDMYYTNLLTGVTTDTNITPTTSTDTNFILANGIHGIGFYTLSNAGTLAAGKAYLHLPTSAVSNSRSFVPVLEDETSTIENIEDNKEATGQYYDLQGRQVKQPTKGLYLINGKKVFIK